MANNEDAVAIGDQALASGFHSTAVGGEARATGTGAQAFGWQANAGGNLSAAVGHQANAAGLQSTAVGKNASAGQANATALGFGATTTRANQVMLGGAGSSVTVGDIAASTASQNGATFFATVDGSGTLGQGASVASLATASSLATTNANVSSNTGAIKTANSRIADNTASIVNLQSLTNFQQSQLESLFGGLDKAYEGVAMGLAMETPSLPAGTRFGISGGVGYFQNNAAGTIAASARVGDNASISAGVGVGFDSGEVGARGGFQVAW